VASRRAVHSLYDPSLATYGQGDTFDHQAAEGFIRLFGLPLRTQAHVQWIGRTSEEILQLSAGAAGPEPGTAPAYGADAAVSRG
jgi:argininosuccinate synthase